ncbi:MAG: glycosyltransferase [Bacteroidota bacterium]
MTFWLITTEYPPMSGGGISTYCYHTAKMMAQNRHKVTVFIPNWSAKKASTSNSDSIRLIHFPVTHYEFFGDEAGLSFCISEIIQEYIVKEGSPDVIEAQEYNGIAYYTLQRKLLEADYLKDTTFLITAHAPGFLYLDYNQTPTHKFPAFWIGEMEKSVLVSADLVFFPSKYLEEKLNSCVSLSLQKTHVITNPFPIEQNPILEFQKFDLVFFGKLVPQKGCLEMLSYFSKLWDSGFKHTLTVVGGEGHFFHPRNMDMGDFIRKKYNHYIKHGLLKFEGHLEPGKAKVRLEQAHVVIVPSIVDNLPYTVVEAMSLGKVVLASENGGHRELIENYKSGFLFEHDENGSSFTGQLNKILELSDEEVYRIGIAANERINKLCSYETVYQAKISLINNTDRVVRGKFPFTRPIERKLEIKQSASEKNLLSIIVPYFNLGDFVEETLDSISKSTYKNHEVIIVNDGSSHPASVKKLADLEKQYDFKLINKPNTGLPDTRNIGAEAAQGEFLTFLDADDTVEDSYYLKAIRILKKYENVSLVGCWAQYFGETNYIWPTFNPEPPYLLVHNTINSSALVYKRNHFLTAGLNDKRMIYGMEDYDSVLTMVKNGFGGVALPQKLWNYRIRRGSLAQSFNANSKNYLYRLLANKHVDVMSEYTEEIINLLNANGKGMEFDNPTKKLGLFHTIGYPFKNSKITGSIKRNKLMRKIAKKLIGLINS